MSSCPQAIWLAMFLPVPLLHLELRYACTTYVRPRRPCICLLGTPLCQCHTTLFRSRLLVMPRCLDSFLVSVGEHYPCHLFLSNNHPNFQSPSTYAVFSARRLL